MEQHGNGEEEIQRSPETIVEKGPAVGPSGWAAFAISRRCKTRPEVMWAL